MSYKLLGILKWTRPSKYKKIVGQGELVAGVFAKFRLEIKNLSNDELPTGIVKCKLRIPYGMGEYTITPKEQKIPALKPDKIIALKLDKIFINLPGLWFFEARYEPIAKEAKEKEIEYYQDENGEADKKRFFAAIHAVDQHQLDVKMLLEEILRRGF